MVFSNIKNFIFNTLWQIIEYFFKVVITFFVTFYVAKYLGPEQFGIISLLMSLIAIPIAISKLGMESILVREISNHKQITDKLLGTSFIMITFVSFSLLIIYYILIKFFEISSFISYLNILIVLLVFQNFYVIDYYFQAKMQSKYSSIAKIVAIIISAIIKILLVIIEAKFDYFIFALLFDYFIISFMLFIVFLIKKENNISTFKFDINISRNMIRSSFPMIISSLAGMIYMRMDQLMIGFFLDMHSVGIYSAASKIYEGLIMIPYILSISLLPVLTRLKKSNIVNYHKSLILIFRVLFFSTLFFAVLIIIFSQEIILITFGKSYLDSYIILNILIVAAPFATLGSMTGRYLIIERMEKIIAYRMFYALLLNFILNIILINIFGVKGAAVATIISIISVNFVFNYFNTSLVSLVKIINSSLFWKTNENT